MNRQTRAPTPDQAAFLEALTTGEATPLPAGEEWADMIQRTSKPDRIEEVAAETFDYFLGVLPPKWMNGPAFAFAEGMEPLRLFWEKGGRFFARTLTWAQCAKFCGAVGLPKDYWAY